MVVRKLVNDGEWWFMVVNVTMILSSHFDDDLSQMMVTVVEVEWWWEMTLINADWVQVHWSVKSWSSMAKKLVDGD